MSLHYLFVAEYLHLNKPENVRRSGTQQNQTFHGPLKILLFTLMQFSYLNGPVLLLESREVD